MDQDFLPINTILLDHLLTKIGVVDTALVLGCGTGNLVIKLAKRGIRTDGVDSLETSLDQARQEAKDQKVDLLTRFAEMDLNNDPPLGKTYDLIILRFTWASIESKPDLLDKIKIMLNTQGYFILQTPVKLIGQSYDDHIDKISTDYEETKNALSQAFGSFEIFKEDYFDEKGFLVTFVTQKV